MSTLARDAGGGHGTTSVAGSVTVPGVAIARRVAAARYAPGSRPTSFADSIRLRRLGQSRRELFEAVERDALRPLPTDAYVYAVWARPKVSIDDHVAFQDHYYSVACALAHKACRDGFTVAYRRVSRLYDELAQARAAGTYLTALRRLAKVQLLVLDDFGLEPLGAAERKGLLEILEDRYNVTATLVTSQLDPTDWHAVIGDATVGDGICDWLVHGAHRLTLRGESLRKAKAVLTPSEKSKK